MSENNGKVASIPDRIRGFISIVLCLISMTLANTTTDQQWQVTFIVFGVLMLLTTLGMVFENGVDAGGKS